MKLKIAWVPSILLALAVLTLHVSGNDKAPYLVLLALLIGLVIFIGLFASVFLSKKQKRGAWRPCAIAALPWLYVAVAIILAKQRLVDPVFLLGFR